MGAGFTRAKMNIWPSNEAGPAEGVATSKRVSRTMEENHLSFQVWNGFMAHLLVGVLSCLLYFSCLQHKLLSGCLIVYGGNVEVV